MTNAELNESIDALIDRAGEILNASSAMECKLISIDLISSLRSIHNEVVQDSCCYEHYSKGGVCSG